MTGLDPPQHGVRHNGLYRLADDVPTLAEQLRGHGFATAAFVGAAVLHRDYGLARGFDSYDDRTGRRATVGQGGLGGFAERRAAAVVDAALAWLEQAQSPFLLWVHLYDPHADYQPPPGFRAALPGRPYDAEIAYTDAQLGRLVDAVEARWPDGRTLWLATSDHGESLGEHDEATHANTVYDATQRVPLLARGPGVVAGTVVATPVALRDVAPTLLARLGAPPLAGAAGRDLSPWLRGGGAGEAPAAYVETLATQLDWGWSPVLGLRTAGFKYLRAPRPELYDLAADPGETRNLAAAQPERVAALDAALEQRLAGARPPAPTLSPGQAERERLEALGYAVGAAGIPAEAIGRVGGSDPKDGVARVSAVMQANQALRRGRPREALDILDRVAAAPGRAGLTEEIVRCSAALAEGELAAAERAARAALAAAPEHPRGALLLGHALLARERTGEARSAFRAAARSDPGDGKPLLWLGRIEEAAGRPEAALAEYRLALGAPRAATEAGWRLAALEIEGGAAEQAGRRLAALPAAELDAPKAAQRLAAAEQQAGRLEAALARLAAAAREHPSSLALRTSHAEALAGLGRHGEARSEAEAALALAQSALAQLSSRTARLATQLEQARALHLLGRDGEARRLLVELREAGDALPWEFRAPARGLARRLGEPEA
jgi:arylsulfatase A-like enzyme